jgi:hypothetical protein
LLTFAVVALFLRKDGFSGDYPRTVLLEGPPERTVAGLRLLAAAIFLLTIGAGLFGVQDAYRNLITTMVWIIWWVGLAFVCALVGDLWALVNPLRTIYGWAEKLFAAMTGGRARWAYPASFVGAMVMGGMLGFGGAALPVVEPTILASIVVLGAAIAFALRPPLPLACG